MDHEKVRAIIRRENEEMWHARNPQAFRTTSHAHRVSHDATLGKLVGHDEHEAALAMFHNAFTDHHMRIDHLIVEGDMAACRITHRARHSGEFMGIPPTGKEIHVTNMFLSRIEGDRIAEKWSLWDGLGLLQQLGAIPMPGESQDSPQSPQG